MLLKDRNLKIALLISASWHVLCMLVVSPVIIRGDTKENSTTISFLGSILERIVAIPERPLSLNRVYFMENIKSAGTNSHEDIVLTQPEPTSRSTGTEADKRGVISCNDKGWSFPFKFYRLRGERREKERFEFTDILIAGNAKNRAILFRPDLPKILLLDSNFSSDYEVTVKFRISRHGFVQNPECSVSSGSFEIDQMAIRYVREWQFVPDEEGATEGAVRINFR